MNNGIVTLINPYVARMYPWGESMKAVLTKMVRFNKWITLNHPNGIQTIDEIPTIWAPGTVILVDPIEHIAFHDNEHVSVEPESFRLLS